MSIHVALNHVTSYSYDRLINLGPQVIRLRPVAFTYPHPLLLAQNRPRAALHQLAAGSGGQLPCATGLPGQTREFRIEVDLVAEMSVINPFDFFRAARRGFRSPTKTGSGTS